MKYVFVHGTGDRRPAWARPGSPMRETLWALGWQHYQHPLSAFSWSGEVGRLLWFLNRRDWEAAGESLRNWAQVIHEPVAYISHSHGAQVVMHAAALGMKVPIWIDISGPIRRDVLKVYPQAKAQIGLHLYVHDAGRWGDWMRIGGQLFDGSWGFPLQHPYATSIGLKDVGHSGVLTEPKHLHFWKDAILPALAIT